MTQFANDSMTPAPLTVTRDKFGNEIAADKPMHENATPGEGSWSFDEEHYDDGPSKGGFQSYGTAVSGNDGPSSERTTVDNSRADRGKES